MYEFINFFLAVLHLSLILHFQYYTTKYDILCYVSCSKVCLIVARRMSIINHIFLINMHFSIVIFFFWPDSFLSMHPPSHFDGFRESHVICIAAEEIIRH